MTKRLFVVGGNGFAKECVQYIRWNILDGDDIEFGGLVGHNGYRVDFGELNNFFIGDLSECKFGVNDFCIIGAGYPELRYKIFSDILKFGLKLDNLFYPYINFPSNLDIGIGNCFISSIPLTECTDIKIGNGNLFNGNVVIGHDVKIGDFNFFGPSTHILGNVSIGNSNIIGTNTIMLPNAKIGNDNKIAPLSCIYKGCKNNTYMHGNPALNIGTTKQCIL